MLKRSQFAGAFVAVGFMVAGCGGGSGTGAGSVGSFADLSNSLASLNASGGSLTFTPEANMATGSATYNGVANIGFGTGVGMRDSALGALTVNVDFTGDTLSGSINNFFHLDQSAASGSMTITNGVLTGNNTSGIGDGLTADASGTVSGQSLNMDVTGHFSGSSADVLYLYLDGKSDSSLGVGLGAK